MAAGRCGVHRPHAGDASQDEECSGTSDSDESRHGDVCEERSKTGSDDPDEHLGDKAGLSGYQQRLHGPIMLVTGSGGGSADRPVCCAGTLSHMS